MIRISVRVLEVKTGIGKASKKEWHRALIGFGETLVRIFVTADVAAKLREALNQEVEVTLKIGSDRELNPRVDIESVNG